MTFRSTPTTCGLVCAILISGWLLRLPGKLKAQTTTTGEISGAVRDPQGAAVPGATVTLTDTATSAVRTQTTSASGRYAFSLLRPGEYTVAVTAPGFHPQSARVQAPVGQVATANLAMQVSTATQTVTVTAAAAPVQTTNGNVATNFSQLQVQSIPNGGGDLTAVVQTTPGAVMNTQAGYGNFSTFGLPATSNLFTINGMSNNDPFFNENNSGPTNLLMGQNDVGQVTVVNNGYSGQYGQLGGANVNFVTKSGSNNWHGNAIYYWNGRVMNANNFFNNKFGEPRPFDNANQWQASIGGPLVKDKTFFFIDTEGLYVMLPTSLNTKVPSPAFQAATLANLATNGNSAEIPFYTSMFNLYNGAPGLANAVPVAGGGCGAGFSLPGGAACALEFNSSAGNKTHEWRGTVRLDQSFGAADHAFLQLSTDHGVQATYTDPISSQFNGTSEQPEYDGQLNWTHGFGANAVNEMILNAQYYSALFNSVTPAGANPIPATIGIAGGLFSPLGGENYLFPQGRRITKYGLVDNFSDVRGASTYRFGVNYAINFINDYDFGIFTTPQIVTSMSSFYNGVADTSIQAFPSSLNQPIRLYSLGAYLEDDIAVTRGLHVTLAIRAEHDSNPICINNCFARLISPFTALNHDPTIPYNAVIQSGLAQAYPSYRHLLWQPRFGFAWTPFATERTVLRGGFGIFNDMFPATAVDNFATNPPENNTFVVSGGVAPGPGSVYTAAAADNTSVLNAFASGGTVGSISAANPAFTPPDYFTTDGVVRPPRYQEWNLEIEQAIGNDGSFSLNYVGNHGVHETIQNQGVNAYAPGFTGLPSAPPDVRFGTVNQLVTGGVSSYNGLTVSLRRRFSPSFQMQVNYTWSHALDDVSNGGFLQFNYLTNQSILGVQDPYNIFKYNYGNSDYDIRHSLSLNYVWQVPFRDAFSFGPSELWRGWQVSGTLFTRSGLPFTVIDGAATNALLANNYGINDFVFANPLGPGQNGTCTVDKQCLIPADFSGPAATPTGFGNQIRNQFRGPRFFNTDISIIKNTQIPGWEQGELGFGVQMFNLFNHPNFDQPVGDVASAQFGTIVNTVSVPTSIMGAFLGGDVSPRTIVLTGRLTF